MDSKLWGTLQNFKDTFKYFLIYNKKVTCRNINTPASDFI